MVCVKDPSITATRRIAQLGLQCSWTLAAEAAEYRESLAIEERIKSDPRMREHWIEHQMLEDSVTEDREDEEASV